MANTSKDTRREAPPKSGNAELKLIQWPPKRLENVLSKPLEILLSLLCLFMVAVIIAYIGILLLNDGRDIESFPRTWKFASEFSRLGPTIVPLIFAFVVGRTVRSYTHWRLQKGESIGTLDSLFGSTTLTGTITTILDLKKVGILGLSLMIIWSLSPLGGQAALRVLTPRAEEISSTTSLPYLSNEVPFPSRYATVGITGQQIPINALVLGSLGATEAVKRSKVDTWGNVRIPMLESFSNHTQLDSNEWILLNRSEDDVVYAALVGLPIANVSQRHRSSFALETSYLKLDCTELREFPGNASKAVNIPREGCRDGACNQRFKWGELATVPYPQGMRNSTRVTERCVVPGIAARELLYWDYNSVASGGGHTMAKCSMTTSFVDVRVICSGWDCEVTAIRPTALAPGGSRRTNITFFDSCPKEDRSVWNWFFQCFSTLTDSGSGGVGVTTILQSYLVDPNLGFNSTAARNLPPVYTIAKELFSVRLSQILNTYWLAMIGNEPLFLGHPENYDGVTTWSSGSGNALSYDNYVFSKSEATVYVRVQALRYDKAWMAVLIVSTFVLLLTAVLDIALSLKIWVPKLLMNISTLTRGNPNFDVPAGGGALSDEARAKLLANVKVRFGDAEGLDESSDLIIGNCVEHGGRVSKLTKGKLYT